MPYSYLKKDNVYGLKNIKTGQIIWYDPKKVKSVKDLKRMARLREAYAHGFVPTKKRGLAQASKATRRRVSRMGGKAKR